VLGAVDVGSVNAKVRMTVRVPEMARGEDAMVSGADAAVRKYGPQALG